LGWLVQEKLQDLVGFFRWLQSETS
jgi:hypothetical protein